jgi:hypothetical protein
MNIHITFEVDDEFGKKLLSDLAANDKIKLAAKPIRKKIEKKETTSVTFPPLWAEKAQAGFYRWIEYRLKINKPLTEYTLQAQVNKYAEKPKTFCALVDRAIQNGWQGLNEQIPLDQKIQPKGAANQQGTIDAVAQILEECGHEIGRD